MATFENWMARLNSTPVDRERECRKNGAAVYAGTVFAPGWTMRSLADGRKIYSFNGVPKACAWPDGAYMVIRGWSDPLRTAVS